MRLLKLLIALIVIHIGLGFTQMAVTYYSSQREPSTDIVSHTPIGKVLGTERREDCGGLNLGNLMAILSCINNVGDMINGLASFEYGFLSAITADDGMAYNVVMAFRIISVLFWLGLGLGLLYFLFDSNLLTSKLGLALVGGGAVTGLVSGIGAAF